MAITDCLLADICPIGFCLGNPGNCPASTFCPIAILWRARGCTDSVTVVMRPDGDLE